MGFIFSNDDGVLLWMLFVGLWSELECNAMQTSNEKNELVDKLTKLFGILGKTGTGSVEDIFNVYT